MHGHFRLFYMHSRQQFGRWGERVAIRYLRRKGFIILDRNVFTPYGELDVVALDGRELVFIEVKTRRTENFGLPEDSITRYKMEHLWNALLYHCETLRWKGTFRLDVISIVHQGTHPRIRHLQNVIPDVER